jgi:hypothetical protein
LAALKVRYSECASRPKTDVSCQNFKVSLCAAFPKFSPCLNGSAIRKVREKTNIHIQKILIFLFSDEQLNLEMYFENDER